MPDNETRITDPVTGGQKGQKDAQLGALDPQSLLAIARVAGFGAQKYARFNFALGYKWSLSFDAMQRHLLAFWDGEDNDPESGEPHLAHAAWHCMTLLTFAARHRGTDDRLDRFLEARDPEYQRVERVQRLAGSIRGRGEPVAAELEPEGSQVVASAGPVYDHEVQLHQAISRLQDVVRGVPESWRPQSDVKVGDQVYITYEHGWEGLAMVGEVYPNGQIEVRTASGGIGAFELDQWRWPEDTDF